VTLADSLHPRLLTDEAFGLVVRLETGPTCCPAETGSASCFEGWLGSYHVAMNTLEAIESRRSVKAFDPAHELTAEEERTLFEHAILSPTSFNMQNWRLVVVRDKELRAQVREAGFGQAQMTDASLLIVLTADLKAWAKDPQRYWSKAPTQIGETMVSMMVPFYEGNEQLQRDEAMRSIGITAQTLMLAARELGYDSCPMIGFDVERVAGIIRLPEDHAVGMIVVIGKRLKDPQPRGGQLGLEEVVIVDQFER
jgi:nitroreductase